MSTAIYTHVRWMIRRDMPEVFGIETASYPNPWTEDDFIRSLQQRNIIGMVAERDERVVGFVVKEVHRSRYHILNLAVHPDCRRQGVGAAMVGHLINKLQPMRRNRIMLETRESNLASQLFWQAMGFRAISVLRDFYDETDEDAYIFEYRIT